MEERAVIAPAGTAAIARVVLPRRPTHSIVAVLLLLALQAGAASAERDLFAEAERRFRGGNYAFALEAYADFLERFPLSEFAADAAYRVGVAQAQLGRHHDAVASFEQVQLRHRSTRFLRYVNLWAGISLYELQEFDRASTSLSAYLEIATDPDLIPQALLYLGLADVSLAAEVGSESDIGNQVLTGAATALERLQQLPGPPPAAAFGEIVLGYVYALQGRYGQLLALTSDRDPESVDQRWRSQFLVYRAEAYWQLEQYEAAEADYNAIVAAEEVADDIVSVALRRLFIAAERRGDREALDKVTLSAERRFQDSRQRAAFWLHLGIENVRRGSYDRARPALTRATALDAVSDIGNAAVLYLAETFIEEAETAGPASLQEAERVLTTHVAGRSDPWPLVLRLGDVLQRQGDFAGAAAQYSRYVTAHADDPAASPAELTTARYLLAYALYRNGDYHAALLELRTALQAAGSAITQTQLAQILRLETVLLWRTGEVTVAEQRAASYVDRFPEEIPARVDHLRLLYQLKSWSKLLQSAAALTDRVPDLRERAPRSFILSSYLVGLAHFARGEHEAAAISLTRISPSLAARHGLGHVLPYARYYRANAHYRTGDYRTAQRLVTSFGAEYSGHELEHRAGFLGGQAAFSIEDYAAAATAFVRVANSDAEDAPRAGLFAGRSFANSGDLVMAERQFRAVATRFAGTEEGGDATYELAGVMALAGRLREAIRAYADVVSSYPESAVAENASYRRAELLLEEGEAPAARDAFAAYRSDYPNGGFPDGALYWGGVASHQAGEPRRAILLWELLIDQYPASSFRRNALLDTAESYVTQADYQPALTYLNELASRYAADEIGQQAAARLEEVRLLAIGMDEREAPLVAAISAGSADTREGREARLALARIYVFEADRPRAFALPLLDEVAQVRSDPETAAEAQYLAGEYHRRTGNLATAADLYLDAALLARTNRDLMAGALVRATEVMLQAGRVSDATEVVTRIKDAFPGSEWAERGEALLRGARS